jgi:hypothetical protein
MNHSNGLDMSANMTAGAIVVGTSTAQAKVNTQSLLQSSIEQIVSGDFIWYGSDITTLFGSMFLVANFVIGFLRYRSDKQLKKQI